jgi:hypothetical protein
LAKSIFALNKSDSLTGGTLSFAVAAATTLAFAATLATVAAPTTSQELRQAS